MELLIIAGLAFGLMLWMTSRSRKQQRAALSFRDNLTEGQDVMTGSGHFGRIVALDGDRVTLASPDGSQSQWLRAAIAKLVEDEVEDASAEPSDGVVEPQDSVEVQDNVEDGPTDPGETNPYSGGDRA